ncbi:MAG: cyclic pyranopterin monophosphate synthase MoaC [Actinobacteria bacterium]|nr:cyclic pyranopterin monophosphate synthase MoaC [Actinomycetota bacterium]
MTEGPPHPESEARMVDVTGKDVTIREATAACVVRMSEATRGAILRKELKKGDALEVARVAGIMAAKRTGDLIPLCHPITLGGVVVDLEAVPEGIAIRAEVKTAERTGVEMEALTAVTIAALTIYDMVKGIERGVTIDEVRLLRKTGGRSGVYEAD